MTDLQKVLVRKSEIRQRLTEIGATDEPTDELRAETAQLTTEYSTLETRERALIVASDEPEATGTDLPADGEARELRELEGRVSLASYFAAAVSDRRADGAEHELRQAMGLGDSVIPWSAVAPRGAAGDEGRGEQRAVSAAPAQTSIVSDAILARVFRRSDTMYLGVGMPSVGVGEHNYPVLTSVASEPTTLTKDATATQPAVTFTPNVLTPVRLSAQYLWRREDAAVFAGMEEALREDLSMAMSQALDNAIINGNGTAPNVPGFLGGANGALTIGSLRSAQETLQTLTQLMAGEVDGIYANMLSGVRILVGTDSYARAAGEFAAGTDVSAAAYLQRESGGFRASGHIAAKASKGQNAIIHKGVQRAAVAPIWEGLTLIRDDITQARKGQIAVTAVMLYSFKVIRTAQYSAPKLRLDA